MSETLSKQEREFLLSSVNSLELTNITSKNKNLFVIEEIENGYLLSIINIKNKSIKKFISDSFDKCVKMIRLTLENNTI